MSQGRFSTFVLISLIFGACSQPGSEVSDPADAEPAAEEQAVLEAPDERAQNPEEAVKTIDPAQVEKAEQESAEAGAAAPGEKDQDLALTPTVPDGEPAPRTPDEPYEAKPGNLQVVNDRETEMAWEILNLPENEASSMAMTELARRWAKTDIEAAAAFAGELPDNSEFRRAFYRGIGEKMAQTDPEALLETIGGGKGLWWQDQWKAETQALRNVAKYDLDAAVAYFTETFPGKQIGRTAYDFSLRIAREQSVDNAWSFVEQLENPGARGRAVEALSRVWMDTNTQDAATFIDGLNDPGVRSYAIRGMLSSIHQTNPVESIAWTMAMDDEKLRQEAVGFLSKRWRGTENAAHLENLLEQNGLTDEEKSVIQTALGR